MKISFKCKVDSKTILSQPVKLSGDKYEYVFKTNQRNEIAEIEIISKVQNPKDYRADFIQSKDSKVPHQLILKGDHLLRDIIVEEFQKLESLMSFSFNLKKIYWESPTVNFIAETEDEKKRLNVSSFTREDKESDDEVRIEAKHLQDMFSTKERYNDLIILKSFFREGVNEFKQSRYINAFFNFYFVIEGIYGNRKTKNIEKEFLASREFTTNLEKIIKEHIGTNRECLSDIHQWLKSRNQPFDVEGVTRLMVILRGEVHHYTAKKTSLSIPFHNKRFRQIAFLAMGLALHGILQRIVAINRKHLNLGPEEPA